MYGLELIWLAHVVLLARIREDGLGTLPSACLQTKEGRGAAGHFSGPAYDMIGGLQEGSNYSRG